MTVMDRIVLVLAGTLLVCAASAAPDQPSPGANACDLLRVPTAGSAAADRLVGLGPRPAKAISATLVAVTREPTAQAPGGPPPLRTSMCTAPATASM